MGKKSRLKRERRQVRMVVSTVGTDQPQRHPRDAEFQGQVDALRAYLARFGAVDAIVSLGVSELWRPNRSSQVKHTFATLVALSMQANEFRGDTAIVTYEEFAAFIGGLRRVLPSFPMLEDFVPEADWGEVRVAGAGGFEPIFYGGSVERIPDFIEAFRLLEADDPGATADMNLAVALQGHIIRTIDASVVGGEDRVMAGHMEVPPAEFWGVCHEALLSTYAAVQTLIPYTSDSLTVELGAFRAPDSSGAFGDAILRGTALPLLFVKAAEAYVPIAPRSASSVVVDLWAGKNGSCGQVASQAIGRRVGAYLSRRLRRGDVIPGPVNVVGTSHRFDAHLAAVIRSGKRFYFILLMGQDELPKLGQIERRLKRLVDESERWGLALADTRQIVEFRNLDGALARADDIQLVAVFARVSTQPMFLRLPKTDARVMGLPDFVSLFDSLKDSAELERFWAYLDDLKPLVGGFVGLMDHFASFRDSHALLIEGAISPDYISLDPHWNSSWRFKDLKTFWMRAPKRFPDDQTTWVVDEKEDGLTCLRAKGPLVLAWSGSAGTCILQATMEVSGPDPDYANGRLLELFVHCVADAITQRGPLLAGLELFRRDHIVIGCEMNQGMLPVPDDEAATEHRASQPLLDGWKLVTDDGGRKLVVATEVNLSRLHSGLERAKDASFEVECAIEVLQGLSNLLRLPCDEGVLKQLRETASRQPRFTIRMMQRTVDVPDHADPGIPEAEHFKLARKELAIVLREQGVAVPARYELEPAKQIMNAARDAMRQGLHARIARYDRKRLLLICVEQHDELTAKYQHEVTRLQLSLSHQVSYDRASLFAEVHEKYTSMARNYRYLLECCVSSAKQGDAPPAMSDVVQLIASVDWLSVLYSASDTLHNGIDVGGIELDDSFVPTVFFSEDRDSKDRQFLQDVANAKLGIGLLEEDGVNSAQDSVQNWGVLDQALSSDLGFSLTQLTQVLQVLSHWHSAGGAAKLSFSYSATPTAIVDRVRERLPDLPADAAKKVVTFLTLDPAGVRRLAGKQEDEPDVPIWEHFKRVHRYLIRPLVQVDEDLLAWGAATADRALSIWTGSFANGYQPADFQWPNVARVVRDIKAGIEKQLEVRAHEICGRHTAYVVHGIDFRRRFPREQFDDVGDFDVLAYWPDRNLWLSIECKYNQPPFCLKDGRRLRARVFGEGSDRGQFSKIERRRHFLTTNVDQLRVLLQWPESWAGIGSVFREAYVCRDIYWWLKHPPYAVPTEFVRVDALDGWLRSALGTPAG